MTEPSAGWSLRPCLWSIIFLAAFCFPRWAVANGADLPPEIVLQGFVKVEDGRAHLLVRVPLVLLSSFTPPKRGVGYLDLAKVDPTLKQVATAIGHQIELSADGATLAPTISEVRLSLLSDRSFGSYSSALAHLHGPPLPTDTDLFWNQGFFDLQLDYVLQSPSPNIAIHANVAPELGQRIKLQLEYIPVDGPARNYEIPGDVGWLPLAPRWFEAAWLFARAGFVDAFAVGRFMFLLCLVAPFRKFRPLLTLILVLTVLQALTLTAAAEGALADVEIGWLPAFADTAVAAGMVLLAIGNLATPTVRRRWFIAALVGALCGFGLGRLLTDLGQFAGTHTLVAVVSFNAGVALGEVVSLAIAFVALRVVFASVLGPLLGVIVLSALLGHAGWHWMIDVGRDLGLQVAHAPAASMWSASGTVALWLIPALLVGVIAYFLPRRSDGVPVPTLLRALRDPEFP